MRKWTYLVASLLLVGATATFTGCIDTDEPEGISVLRGAKADLIKAKTAVELVKVDMEKALVAAQLLMNENQTLVNKIKEVELEKEKINLELHKLEVDLKKLYVEREKAGTEAFKKEMDAKIAFHEMEIAKWQKEKADWENKKALAAEEFKAALLNYQKQTAEAEFHYGQALDAIAAAKLILGDGEIKVLDAAYARLNYAKGILDARAGKLQTAQEKINTALLNLDDVAENPGLYLADDLKAAELELKGAELALAKAQELFAKDVPTTNWAEELKKLEADLDKLRLDNENQNVAIQKIKNTQAWKDAKKDADDKTGTYNTAKTKYDAGKVTERQKDLEIAKFEDAKTIAGNVAVIAGLDKAKTDLAAKPGDAQVVVTGYDATKGIFSYVAGKYKEEEYKDKTNANFTTNAAATTLATVDTWLAMVDEATKGINLEDIAWSTRTLASAKADATTATTAYNTALTEWKTAVANYNANDVPDLNKATTTVEAAIAAWNGITAARTMADVNKLGDALATFYAAADQNIKQTNKTVSSSALPPVTKEISAWMLDGSSYFRNVVAPALGLVTYNIVGTDVTVNTSNAISAAVLGQLTTLRNGTGKSLLQKLEEASLKAFGAKMYMFNEGTPDQKPRLTEPTVADIATATKNIAEQTFGPGTAAQYGALGAKIATAAEVTRLENILAQADTYKTLRAAIVAQQTALKAEIAANTKKVEDAIAALKKTMDDANTAKKAADKTLADLTKKEDDKVKENNTLITDLNALKTVLKDNVEGYLGAGKTIEEFKLALEKAVAGAEKNVTTAKAKITKIKAEIKLYEAGDYSPLYTLNRLQEDLKLQTAEFGLAQVAYNEALDQLAKLIDMLSKKY